MFTFIDLTNFSIGKKLLGILLIIFVVISLIDKIKSNKDKDGDMGKINELVDSQELMKTENRENQKLMNKHHEKIVILTTKLTKHGQQFRDWKEKKETSLQLINELIQNGIITEGDAYHNFESTYMFIIYCYAKSLPKAWGFGGRRRSTITRLYPEFFKRKLGCIRVINIGGIFVTNSKRLPNELQNSYNLKNYCIAKLDYYLKKEWKLLLKELKQQKLPEYKTYKGKNYKKFTSLALSVFRCSINDKNIGKIREFTFPEEFNELINEEVNLKKLGLPKEKKAKVKEFIKSSSLELVFKGIEPSIVNRIIEIEQDLKEGLEIKSIFDYLERGTKKIETFLINKDFTSKDANFYSKRIISKLEEYRDSLNELNIIL